MNDELVQRLVELTGIIKSVLDVEHEMRGRAAEAALLYEQAQRALEQRIKRLSRLALEAAAIDEERAAAGKRLLATVEQMRAEGTNLDLAAYPRFAQGVQHAAEAAREYLAAMALAMKRVDTIKTIFSADAAQFDDNP
jgi:hypothetical protein